MPAPKRFQTVVLPIGQSALRDQVRALRDSPAFQQAAHPPEAIALYSTLIAPLKNYLTTSDLAIMPHGVLHYLPFAALTDGQRYLADDYVLSVLPSASALPFIQANTGRPAAPPLILGNPDGTLRFAEREAQAVAALYGVTPLLGNAGTEQALRTQVRRAGILYLAVHGRYDPVVPLASLLALAPGAEQRPDMDGRLEAGEVYSLDLKKADLVVLSACQTSLGEVSDGDEVVGLTRAFFFAGTPTVVSSLWNVDDEATGLLMERFYTHLRAGMGKAAALRQAQLEVRAQYPAPYYWAGFVLAGDAGTLPTDVGWRWLAVGDVLAWLMVGLAGALLWLHHRLIPDWGT
jgi:CHAT domain-containing protein